MTAKATHSTPKKGRNELRKSRERFIAALRNTANVRASAQAAGVDRKTVYNWRNASKTFAAQWDEALEDAVDTLEAAAVKRARDGYEKPVYQGGEMVGTVMEYSDTLLIFLMKAHRPRLYRETINNNITINWRDKVKQAGYEPDELFRNLVEAARERTAATIGGSSASAESGEGRGEAPADMDADSQQSASNGV